MDRLSRGLVVLTLLLLVALGQAQSTRDTSSGAGRPISPSTFVAKVGSAGSTGLYHSAGNVLCDLVNASQQRVRCEVEATTGTLVNLSSLRAGELEFAFAQSDWISYAMRGSGPFRGHGAFADVRSVFSLHMEALTIVVRPDSDLTRVDDLRARSVNVGPIGSGSRATFEAWLAAQQQTRADFAKLSSGPINELAGALCSGGLDAYWLVIGHPAPALQEGVDLCGLRILPLTGPAVERFVRRQPQYRPMDIPGNAYRGQTQPVPTVGVEAVFVSHTRVPDDVVYALVRSVFERLSALRQAHPALAGLDPREMATRGVAAPIHPGALRYYRERGWM
jgi:uncharacterized protein